MSLITWIRDLFTGRSREVDAATFFDCAAEYCIMELAFWTAANLMARSISKCEFKTFVKNVETRGGTYYMWNVSPNRNQNSSEFLQQIVTTLYRKNECLVVSSDDGQLLVADSFSREERGLLDDLFTNVTVKTFTFRRTFAQSDVMYFRLCNKDVTKLLSQIYATYGKMIAYAESAYQKSRGSKGTLEVPMMPRGTDDEKKWLENYLSGNAKKFLESNNGILPLYNGYKYTEIGSKTYANDSTRDIRAMIDDIYDLTARALCIPPALLRGDASGAKDVTNNFLTFGTDPLADMLMEEINRKQYGQKAYLEGTRLEIDTKCIKHVDLLEIAGAIDKLISSGGFCVNDIRKLVGEVLIDEPWAWQHFMTKNYAPTSELLAALKEKGVEEIEA